MWDTKDMGNHFEYLFIGGTHSGSHDVGLKGMHTVHREKKETQYNGFGHFRLPESAKKKPFFRVSFPRPEKRGERKKK